jgi:hypothetical protein
MDCGWPDLCSAIAIFRPFVLCLSLPFGTAQGPASADRHGWCPHQPSSALLAQVLARWIVGGLTCVLRI